MQMTETIQSGNFTFINTPIGGVVIIESKSYGDSRGYFIETYKRDDFINAGIASEFVQDNQSLSMKGVLRGLHFQINHPQAKLVRVAHGAIFDVAVDLRLGSPTYPKWTATILSDENHRQLFIPKNFAHGFLTLSESALVCYKCDDIYHPNDEGGIIWNDPDIGIKWEGINDNGSKIILSEKDAKHKFLKDIKFTSRG